MRFANWLVVLMAVMLWDGAPDCAAEAPAGQKDVAELEKEVGRLRAKVRALEERLAGKGAPVNLGRTSIAAVSASSVNGSRALNNNFYGVTNAFDDGANWINNINYTYWLTGGDAAPWIEVTFDVPVAISQVQVEGGPAFSTQFTLARGGEQMHEEVNGGFALELPVHGVKSVRLTFGGGGGNVRVNEVRVMGFVPDDVKYQVCTPRIFMNHKNAEAIATAAFQQFQQEIWQFSAAKVEAGDEAYVVTYVLNGKMPLLRVTIARSTDKVTVEPLVEFSSRKEAKAAERWK